MIQSTDRSHDVHTDHMQHQLSPSNANSEVAVHEYREITAHLYSGYGSGNADMLQIIAEK